MDDASAAIVACDASRLLGGGSGSALFFMLGLAA
jgi:hypothetical protein